MQYSRSLSLKLPNISGVTLHSSKIIPCLGEKSVDLLARFRVEATSENLLLIGERALGKLGLMISDISGITTDGATSMCKLGKLMQAAAAPQPFYHQLCFAHALHLAVKDTLLRKSKARQSNTEENEFETYILAGIVEDDSTRKYSTVFFLSVSRFPPLFACPAFV